MKFRCPYCKYLLEGEPAPRCPSCGKTLILPQRLRHNDRRDSRRIREAIIRDAERKKKALGISDLKFGNRRSGVLFAVAILSVAGILLLSRANFTPPAKARTLEMKAAQDLGVLNIALNRFKNDCGRYPTTQEGLFALINNPGITNWPKPYVFFICNDPWHVPYIYEYTNNTLTLYSSGPDKQTNSIDDIYPPEVFDPMTGDPIPPITRDSPAEPQPDIPSP